MSEQTTELLEPRSTVGLELETAIRIIGSRKLITKAGYYPLKVINEPNYIVVELEGDPLKGQGVYLVNLAGTTTDLNKRAEELLARGLEVHEAGDSETAELFFQDAGSQTLVRRINENAKWIPSAGEIVKAMVEKVVPESGPNKGKPVMRVTSIAPMAMEEDTRTVTLSGGLADKLKAMGIDARALGGSKETPEDKPEDVNDGSAPQVD